MNIRIFLFLAIIFFANDLMSQHRFGVRANYSVVQSRSETRYIVQEEKSVSYNLRFEKTSPMLSYGVFSQHDFGWLWLQNEILYSSFKQEFTIKSYLESDELIDFETQIEKNKYLDISIMSGIRFNQFRYGVGPIFHLFGKVDSDLVNKDFYRQDVRKITAGFQAGIGYDFKHVHIDFKYESVFRSAGDHIRFNDGRIARFKQKPQVITLGIGVSI